MDNEVILLEGVLINMSVFYGILTVNFHSMSLTSSGYVKERSGRAKMAAGSSSWYLKSNMYLIYNFCSENVYISLDRAVYATGATRWCSWVIPFLQFQQFPWTLLFSSSLCLHHSPVFRMNASPYCRVLTAEQTLSSRHANRLRKEESSNRSRMQGSEMTAIENLEADLFELQMRR